jgi:hypothetical protein
VTGGVKQQTANSKQQTANSKQQTANSKQQREHAGRLTAVKLTCCQAVKLTGCVANVQ